jgi:plastocyanin
MTKTPRLKRSLTLALGLSAAVVLASCSQTGDPVAASTALASPAISPGAQGHGTTGAQASTSPAASTPAAGKRIEITVKGKQVTPAPTTVDIAVGETLTVAVTSDHDDQLHAHGFEVEKDVRAGQRLEITVKGAQTGVFEFELHHPALRLLQVAVR